MAVFAALTIASTSCAVISPQTAVMIGMPPSMHLRTDGSAPITGLNIKSA
jgi:hypothetical protein